MDWVKLSTSYHLEDALMRAGEPAEILWSRGLAHAGLKETDGVITREALPRIVATRGRQRAQALVREGLWSEVPEGWRIRNWEKWQPTKAELEQWRKGNRERQARYRARHGRNGVRNAVTNAAVTRTEVEEEVEDAAAAASGSRGGGDLPAPLDILRSKMAAYTALRQLRWDKLDQAQMLAIEDLVGTHGDTVLVDVALRTCRTPPPTLVNAFIGTWLALPDPGQKLRLVDEPNCTEPGHEYELARSCRLCAAERHAGERP